MSRPKSKNVFYFPHYTKGCKELDLIEHRHKSEGYKAYYKLLEMLADADYHGLSVNSRDEQDMFELGMNCNPEVVKDVINILVNAERIDRELWESEKVIWMQDFVQTLKPVYANRRQPLPRKDDNIDLSTSNNSISTRSNTQKRKGKKRKEKKSSKATSFFDFKSLISEYKDLDVPQSYDKYLKYHGDNPSEEGFRRWLDKDRESSFNKKKKKFKKTPNGDNIAYCSKCGSKQFPNDYLLKQGSSCCYVEYVPERKQPLISTDN